MAKRTSIPKKVKEFLRNEVGFGCPAPNCGNPYLEYHHFDPPVHITPHNNPEGMIALCAQHHKKADGGLYTNEQLHEFKSNKANAQMVRGNLDWLRRDFLYFIGGNLFYETPVPLQVDGHNIVTFQRDEDGYQRLSVNMISLMAEERVIIEENSWENIGEPLDLRSPPQGKELEIRYRNGDYLYLRFTEINDQKVLCGKYGISESDGSAFKYPIALVEINFAFGGTTIDFSSKGSHALGMLARRNIMSYCDFGFRINTKYNWQQNPKLNLEKKYESGQGNVIKVKFGK